MIELEKQFIPKRRIASVTLSKNNSRTNSIKICSEKDIEDLNLQVIDKVLEESEALKLINS
jgi:hypothetical protein